MIKLNRILIGIKGEKMEEKRTITIYGKTVDCSKLSNEKLIELYKKLSEREKIIDQKLAKYERE